jgi:hypothetical protein
VRAVIPHAHGAVGGTRHDQRLADARVHSRHARAVAQVGEVVEGGVSDDLGEREGEYVDLVILEGACQIFLVGAYCQALYPHTT